MKLHRLLWSGLAAIASGCSSQPAAILPPAVDASQAAAAAMKAYDASGNGTIEKGELDAAAPIKAALARIDANHDGAVSADELKARIQKWQASQTGLIAVSAKVLLDGQPLEGASVTLQPEPALGTAFKAARGTTSRTGLAALAVDDAALKAARLSGVAPGLYRVIITGGQGRSAPAAYGNEKSPLGIEVADDMSDADGVLTFLLKGSSG